MPSDVSDGVVLPEESPPPGSDRGERRARRNGGGFENASSLSPSSRLPPLTAKATRTVSAPSSVRRSAARRAYRCAGSVRSSACSVRKNTTSCLYAAETDGRLGPDWASGPTGPGPAETSASWRNTHRSTSTFFVSFVSPSASDSRKISSTMRRDGGSGAACAASLRHGRNASARDAHSSVSRLNCGDQTHPMFDRRSGRRARGVRGQSREALAVTKRARLGRSREKKRARSVFHVFSWNETRSRVRFGFLENAVVRTASARARRGDAPIGSSGPSRPRRSVADSARAPAAPQTRTSRTTPRESAPRGRPWRSVRPSLSAALKKFPGNHVGEMLERSARREGIPRPATAPRPDARTCAHPRTRSLRGRRGLGEGGRSSRGSECAARRVLQTQALLGREVLRKIRSRENERVEAFYVVHKINRLCTFVVYKK